MSSEKVVFEDILKKTESNEISWSIVGNQYGSNLIFQPMTVYRIFRADYARSSADHYEVLLIEKKYPDPDWDFSVEKYKVEIIFIQNGVLVATLDEYSIELSELVGLARLIEGRSTQAKRLFGPG